MKFRTCVWSIAAGAVFLAIAEVAAAPIGQPTDEVKVVRIPSSMIDSVAGLGLAPKRALDYGTFVWLELSVADFDRLSNAGAAFQVQEKPHTLRLGETSFDPLREEPMLPAAWKQSATRQPALHLIQFAGPPRQEWLNNLEANGLKIVQYVHPHTYIVWGTLEDRNAVATVQDSVRWAGVFEPGYRVNPRWRGLTRRVQDVKVLMYRGADTAAAIQALEGLGGQMTTRQILNQTFEVLGFTLPGSRFRDAAGIPGVYSIQVTPTDGGHRGEMSDQINVNNFDVSNAAFPGYKNWLTSVGVDGNGVIIANVDGGVQNNHPDLVNRLIACSGSTCGGAATDSHGTHTAGIMAADGSSGTTDALGFLRGLGVAPGANLVEQVYNPTFTQPGGMLRLMTQSYNNGASLSGNSWGPAGSPQGYDNDTLQVDIGVRDADPNTPGNQPLTYVLSFMNGGGGTSTQGSPDEAKNIFNIGSTKMQLSSGAQNLNINDVSSNSAHGPALDGRTIPHMVAPGCDVDSSTSGSGYTLMCGTSMASPHVSGAVALFIEYYRNLPGSPPDPSPALIKAAFLPVAKDLAGFRDADNGILGHVFDAKQGWGRMDLEAVVDPQVSVRYFDDPQIFNNTGEEWNVTVSAVDPAQPMRIMLVWTDAPGHGLGGSTPAWNNDLDLVVDAGGQTFLGNVFDGSGWSTTGGVADGKNNTEGVFLGPAAPTAATIRVIASNINSDGIPSTGTLTDQDFALVCYNCAEEAGFTIEPAPSIQKVCAPDDAVFTIDIGQILGFTETVNLSTTGEPPGTSTSFSANPVTPPGNTVLTVSGTGAAMEGSYSIAIDGTSPTVGRTTNVTLDLFTSVPGTSLLTLPADTAVDVSLTPNFSWTAASSAEEYKLQVATDSGFTNIVAEEIGLSDTSIRIMNPLATLTTYFWRVSTDNICGSGGVSDVFSFTTRNIPPILLVDDDDNTPDVRSTYTVTLDAIGQDYDIWDTNNTDNEPTLTDLAPYEIVIWFTGHEFGGTAGPGAAGETALAAFLDAGHCLFISSQDYFFDRGLTGFMQNYLGVQAATNDVSQTSVTGEGTLYGGLGPFTLTYPFDNFSDFVSPNTGGTRVFLGNAGDAAVARDANGYRTTFWGFPFEAIASAAERRELMNRTVDWCLGSFVPTPLAADGVTRNRYLVFHPNSGVAEVALQVELGSSDTFPGATMTKWVGVPDPQGRAALSNTQVTRTWRETTLQVADCGIVTASTYLIRATLDGVTFSEPLVLTTTPKPGDNKHWGDCIGSFDGVQWLPPNGVTNIDDVFAAIQAWQVLPTAPKIDWVDVHPEQPNFLINFSDVQFLLFAFQGNEYPFANPLDCP